MDDNENNKNVVDNNYQRKTQKRPDDDIRLKVLSSLFAKHGLKPNIDHIAKNTCLTRRTVYDSLEYLNEIGVINGYEPRIDPSKLGYSILSVIHMQIDMSNVELCQKFIKTLQHDRHISRILDFTGMGLYNVIIIGIYKSIEEYHDCMKLGYYEKLPELYDIIKKSNVVYFPFASANDYKNASMARQVIDMLCFNGNLYTPY